MIEKLFCLTCTFVILLLPSLSWSLDESDKSTVTEAPPSVEITEKPALVKVPVEPAITKVLPLVSGQSGPVTTPRPTAVKAPVEPTANKNLSSAVQPNTESTTQSNPIKQPVESANTKRNSAVVIQSSPVAASPAPTTSTTTYPTSENKKSTANNKQVVVETSQTKTTSESVKKKPNTSVETERNNPSLPAEIETKQAKQTQQSDEVFSETDSHIVDIEFFIREDCKLCDKAKEFLTKLKKLQPHLKIVIRDVRKEPAALELLKRVAQNQNGITIDYPAFVVSGQLIIGFADEAATAQLILDTLAASHQAERLTDNVADPCSNGKEVGCGLIPAAPTPAPQAMTIRILGHNVPLIHIGLPLFTLAMGLLDGLNFGSTWVLILMISLLAPLKNRSTMLTVAGAFITVQGLIYFFFMSAWLNLFQWVGTSRISEVVIASVSLIVGVLYFKKYLYLGHDIAISSHEISKPGIYTRIRKIVQAQSLPESLLASIMLAVFVQIAEFNFTSVFPALYTRVLTLQHLDNVNNYGYLLLYDAAYMLDDIILLAIGVITLRQIPPQEKSIGTLKLISALVLAGLGVYLLRFLF